MRLFFINRAPDASAAGFDPTQIEFIPGYSYATLGQDLDDPIFPYVLMEGDLNLSYDSGSQMDAPLRRLLRSSTRTQNQSNS